MIVDVLGLGESVKNYEFQGNVTVGVNDIFKYYPVDYLVNVDKPGRFEKKRLNTITESTPLKFYSHIGQWNQYFINKFELINLTVGPRGSIKDIDNSYPFSNNSTFVACVLAYKLGATEINVFGADFNTHPNFRQSSLDAVLKDFSTLFEYLKNKGIKISVSKQSRLNEII